MPKATQRTTEDTQTVYESSWTAASRKAYHEEHPENFAGPDMSYPVKDASDVSDAWNLAGHASDPEAVRAKIISIAKRLGFSHALPTTAKTSTKESTLYESGQAEVFSPKTRVARIKVQWLEDGAISQNNRQYPKETVDALVQSAQIQLSDAKCPPLTCYINHGAADNDNTLELVGRLSQVWKEGTRAMAYIDIPDTRAGRDIASLAAGGYLKTESLRAEAKVLHGKGTPQVSAENARLLGIDFTTTPGLVGVAHIQNVLLEASENEYAKLSEFFTLSSQAMLLVAEKGNHMDTETTLDEATVGAQGLASMTSGDSPSMTSDPTQDSYGQRQYPAPDSTSGPMQGMEAGPEMKEAVQHAHDHSASALGLSCAPAGVAFESGKALNAINRKRLESIHKKSAKALNLECKEAASDGMQDGDDDDQPAMPTEKKESKTVASTYTPAQLAEALRKAGYSVEAPKTEAQILREEMDELKKQMTEARAAAATVTEAAPQRKSYVMGTNAQRKPANMPYTPGRYLREQLKKVDWADLADRTCPLPEGLTLEHLIREFTDIRIVQNFEQFGWPESLARELGVY